MSFNIKKTLAVLTALSLTLCLCACEDSDKKSTATTTTTTTTSQSDISQQEGITDTSDMFSNRDLSGEYDQKDAVNVTLEENKVTASSNNLSFENGVLTVKGEGVYILKGSFNGQIVIDAKDTEKVQLVLNGVNITTDKACGIFVKNADKFFVTTAENSKNTLSASGDSYTEGDEKVDSAVYSVCDLTFNGNGELSVVSSKGHGIVTKDDLAVCGGKISVDCQNHGLKANDSVRISDGSVIVKSQKDGIHSENSDDAEKGFVYIENGSFEFSANGDGISASSDILIQNGNFNITTAGNSSDSSTKGLKASGEITINGGDFTVTSAEDGIHTGGNVLINGGNIIISSKDEGVEGKTITITDGVVDVTASDDGINASDGTSQNFGKPNGQQGTSAGSADVYIKITGGEVKINANGDGIDSNGSIYISGGNTTIYGPTSNGDCAFDYQTTAEITGGVIVALGSSGMAENFTSATQGAILITVEKGSEDMILSDASGEILKIEGAKTYDSVLVSAPQIKENGNYTITANGKDYAVEMTSTLYGSGKGGFGGGNFGGGHGNKPQRPSQEYPENLPEGFTPPDDFTPPEGEFPNKPEKPLEQESE